MKVSQLWPFEFNKHITFCQITSEHIKKQGINKKKTNPLGKFISFYDKDGLSESVFRCEKQHTLLLLGRDN